MRIAHLSTCLEYYGGEVCLANLAHGFAARGHEVSCLVRPGSALATKLTGSEVAVVPLPMVDWYDPGTVHRVGQWLRRHRVDILATHLPRDYFIAATASMGLPVCNIATRHHLKPLSLPILKRPFLQNFSAMIAVSDAVARTVLQARLVAPEKVVTVANGIVPPDVSVRPGPGLRERAQVAPDAPVVGLVGKLCPEKGADTLLRAVGRLNADHPDLQVILAGNGGENDGFQQHLRGLTEALGLSGRVHFLGFVPEAGQMVHELDMQVVASHAEPFGLVTLEAIAHGVPVVATRSGGSPEIITDGVEGYLVAPGDEAELADRLARLLVSKTRRREMGRRGRLRFDEHFTLEHMLARTERVYLDALHCRKPRVLAAEG